MPPSASTFELRVATPPELKPKKWLLDWVKKSGAAIRIGNDPEEAVKGADCVVTDTWVSMGDKDGDRRHNLLKPYQVNARLMAKAEARRDLHALPAGASRRGGHRRGDRRAAVGGVRRGGEPPARAEGHPGLVPARAARADTACSSGARVSAVAHYISRNDTASDRHSGARTGEDIRRRHRPAVRGCRPRSARPRGAARAGGRRDSRAATTIRRRSPSCSARRSCSPCCSAPR